MPETSLIAVAVIMFLVALVDAWRVPDRERIAVRRLVRHGMPEPVDPDALVARRTRRSRWLSLGSAVGVCSYLAVVALRGVDDPLIPWALLAVAVWCGLLSAGCAALAKPVGAAPRVARLVSRRLTDYVPRWLAVPADLLILAPLALAGAGLAAGEQRPGPWWFVAGCAPAVLVLLLLAVWTRRLVSLPTRSADTATLLWTEVDRVDGLRTLVASRIVTSVLATVTLFNAWYGIAGLQIPPALAPFAWAAGLAGLALVVVAVTSTWIEQRPVAPSANSVKPSLRQSGVS